MQFEPLPEDLNSLAYRIYTRYRCRKVTHDRRERCNPIVIYGLVRAFYEEAKRFGVDYHVIDVYAEIDPDQPARWNIAHLSSFIRGTRAREEGKATIEDYEKLSLNQLREVEDAFDEMQREYYEELLEKLKAGEIPPEFEGLTEEEIAEHIRELEELLREKFKKKGEVRQEELAEWLHIEEEVEVTGPPGEELGSDEKVKAPPPPVVKPLAKPTPLPKMIEIYLSYLNLNLAQPPRQYEINREVVYFIPVVDEGTGEVVTIVYPFPAAQRERFKMTTITNKRGLEVSVLVPVEEEIKVAPVTPSETEVESAIERGEQIVPEQPQKIPVVPVDWKYVEQVAEKFQEWVQRMKREASKRSKAGIRMYLESMKQFLEQLKKRFVQTDLSGFMQRVAEKPKPVVKVLRDYEYKELHDLWRNKLAEAGIDWHKYESRFGQLIDWGMNFEDNKLILLDELRKIIALENLKGKVREIPEKPREFNWKWVNWALSSISVDVQLLKDAIKQRNPLQALRTIGSLEKTVDTLLKLIMGV